MITIKGLKWGGEGSKRDACDVYQGARSAVVVRVTDGRGEKPYTAGAFSAKQARKLAAALIAAAETAEARK